MSQDLASLDVETLLGEQGEAVTFTPGGGAARSIVAIVLRSTRQDHAARGQAELEFTSIEMVLSARSDVEGVVSPAVLNFGTPGAAADTVLCDGTTWIARTIVQRNVGGLHRILFTDRPVQGIESL